VVLIVLLISIAFQGSSRLRRNVIKAHPSTDRSGEFRHVFPRCRVSLSLLGGVCPGGVCRCGIPERRSLEDFKPTNVWFADGCTVSHLNIAISPACLSDRIGLSVWFSCSMCSDNQSQRVQRQRVDGCRAILSSADAARRRGDTVLIRQTDPVATIDHGDRTRSTRCSTAMQHVRLNVWEPGVGRAKTGPTRGRAAPDRWRRARPERICEKPGGYYFASRSDFSFWRPV